MKKNRLDRFVCEFLDTIPNDENLKEGVLYISIKFYCAMHRCFCGCGEKVYTPIRPDRWHLTFDGDNVSLHPSIGSFQIDCKSHYWMKQNKVIWIND